MQVWRISPSTWAEDALTGIGAEIFGGRWNRVGAAIVYTSSHLSLAAQELFVHLDQSDVPDDLVAISIEIPSSIVIEKLAVKDLPRNWRELPPPNALADIGEQWLESRSSVALEVPSVVIPVENNLLLNPAHPDFARLIIGDAEPFQFDPRMWK